MIITIQLSPFFGGELSLLLACLGHNIKPEMTAVTEPKDETDGVPCVEGIRELEIFIPSIYYYRVSSLELEIN
jgi:hypothetical protein